ncbi:hypothetical protein KSO98_13325 [Nocardioides sp. R-N-C8]|nr:hypothetical protein [Nocardioides nematodiphilus]MCA1983852.1 hypothetical protein [Nocardioides nematodiphilus]
MPAADRGQDRDGTDHDTERCVGPEVDERQARTEQAEVDADDGGDAGQRGDHPRRHGGDPGLPGPHREQLAPGRPGAAEQRDLGAARGRRHGECVGRAERDERQQGEQQDEREALLAGGRCRRRGDVPGPVERDQPAGVQGPPHLARGSRRAAPQGGVRLGQGLASRAQTVVLAYESDLVHPGVSTDR